MGRSFLFDGKRNAKASLTRVIAVGAEAFRETSRTCKQVDDMIDIAHGILLCPFAAYCTIGDVGPGADRMTDVVSPATRSRMMAGIRGKDTKPELRLRKALFARGFRYRLHDKSLPGKPDIVLRKHNTVIQVHGCFWHRHEGCRYATIPATRPEFWKKKFADNVARDRRNDVRLRELGWTVVTVWECEIRDDLECVANHCTRLLNGQSQP